MVSDLILVEVYTVEIKMTSTHTCTHAQYFVCGCVLLVNTLARGQSDRLGFPHSLSKVTLKREVSTVQDLNVHMILGVSAKSDKYIASYLVRISRIEFPPRMSLVDSFDREGGWCISVWLYLWTFPI